MALEKVSTILKMADEKNTSALAFNCIDYNMAYSVIKAAEQSSKPAIIMLYPEHCYKNNASNPASFAGIVKGIAKKATVPIGLHLDHSSDFKFIIDAIRSGFTSVMYDGSHLSVEENIENTKKVVEIAEIFGADVEAELGRVGFACDNDGEKEDLYTPVEVAEQFCKQTNITSVAIAIGSAHGVYTETPKLDLERLRDINAATKTYLVLHGGSGIPEDQLESAFCMGINKFNVGTEFFQLYYDSIKEYCETFGEEGNVFNLPQYTQEKLIRYLLKKLRLSKM